MSKKNSNVPASPAAASPAAASPAAAKPATRNERFSGGTLVGFFDGESEARDVAGHHLSRGDWSWAIAIASGNKVALVKNGTMAMPDGQPSGLALEMWDGLLNVWTAANFRN